MLFLLKQFKFSTRITYINRTFSSISEVLFITPISLHSANVIKCVKRNETVSGRYIIKLIVLIRGIIE